MEPQSQSTALSITCISEAQGIASRTSREFMVMTAIKAPDYQPGARVPIDLIAIIDKSSSMSRDLALVQETINFVVENLSATDRLGIISYSDHAEIDLPLTLMDSSGKRSASAAMQFFANGSTNLSGGLLLGLQEMRERKIKNGVASVLLFTDGEANIGFTTTRDIIRATIDPEFAKGTGSGLQEMFQQNFQQAQDRAPKPPLSISNHTPAVQQTYPLSQFPQSNMNYCQNQQLSQSNLFGQTQQLPQSNVFGTSQQLPQSNPFGQTQQLLQSNPFGQAGQTQQLHQSNMNYCQTQHLPQSILFGNTQQLPQSNRGGLFGQTEPQSNLFGNTQQLPQSNRGGLFGQTEPQSNLFGNTQQLPQSNPFGLFGQTEQLAQSNIFGQTQQLHQSNMNYCQTQQLPQSNLFGNTQQLPQSNVNAQTQQLPQSNVNAQQWNPPQPTFSPQPTFTPHFTNELPEVTNDEIPEGNKIPLPCTINCFGFGSGHNATLLKELSDHGSAQYYYIENREKIAESFADCLGGLISTVGQNLTLTFEALGDVKIKKLCSKFKVSVLSDSKSQLFIGDIQSEEEKDLICILDLPASSTILPAQLILKVNLNYKNVITNSEDSVESFALISRPENPTGESRNYELDKQYNRVLVSDALEAANAKAISDDMEGAKSILFEASACIRESISGKDKFCQALLVDLKRCQDGLQSSSVFSSVGSKMLMNQAQAHSAQRSTNVAWSAQAAYQTQSRNDMYSNFNCPTSHH